MYFLYSLVFSLTFALLLPYFLYQAIRFGKYKGGLGERLGRLPARVRGDGSPTLWVHTVSVGEFVAAQPLIEALKERFPEHRTVVSTTTMTGQHLARARLSAGNSRTRVFYFPFDWAFTVRRALNHVRPTAVIILETELWPNFLRECRRLGVPTVIANGRISPRSLRGYKLVRGFTARVLADVSLMLMQTNEDRARASSLGARSERLKVCGNLKYDVIEPAGVNGVSRDDLHAAVAEELDRVFDLGSARHLIVAGSTAAGEEEVIVRALTLLREDPLLADTRCVIAPRHPERFDEVAALLANSGFSFARRSTRAGERVAPPARPDVVLLDTIGELAAIYRFASVVFVGGSLAPRGGHNVIEPAVYAKPIIVGPHTENFRQVVEDFKRAEGLVQIGGPAELPGQLARLLLNKGEAEALGRRARGLLAANQGATHCVISALESLIRSSGND